MRIRNKRLGSISSAIDCLRYGCLGILFSTFARHSAKIDEFKLLYLANIFYGSDDILE